MLMRELDSLEQSDETCSGVVVDQMQNVVIGARIATGRVHKESLRVAERDARIALHHFKGLFEKRRGPEVVRRGPF